MTFSKYLRSAAIAVAFALMLVPALARVTSAHPAIDIAASNWKFTPATIEAQVGQPTTLRIISSEGVHGIKSSDLDIAATTIMPDKTTEVTFTPKKAGTYVIHCNIPCGAGHEDMKLTIVVKDS
jgi:cytochrome c oxidase subunit 2